MWRTVLHSEIKGNEKKTAQKWEENRLLGKERESEGCFRML